MAREIFNILLGADCGYGCAVDCRGMGMTQFAVHMDALPLQESSGTK